LPSISPFFGFAPMGDHILIGKSGSKCPAEQGRNPSRVECRGCDGEIPPASPGTAETTQNKSTPVEKFNASSTISMARPGAISFESASTLQQQTSPNKGEDPRTRGSKDSRPKERTCAGFVKSVHQMVMQQMPVGQRREQHANSA
jgi:hypothetical protein